MASPRGAGPSGALRAQLLLALGAAGAAPPDAWRSRSVYQLLVDRFAAVPTPAQCTNYGDYCGGTFEGVTAHLDYIQSLGFDAVWISPVVDNAAGGYHGYWQRDMFSVNSHFGSSADLVALSAALHARGMFLMVDVVANHASSDGDVTANRPFSSAADYHDCAGCPSGCNINDYENLVEMEHCRLAGLMDFNNSDPEGANAQQLYSWIAGLVANYSIDGLRVDTLPYVHPAFWLKFTAAAGGIYAVGEVDNGDVDFVSPWQAPSGANAALPGLLSYPMFWTLRGAFAQKQPLEQIGQAVTAARAKYADTGLLGVFVDNHDNPRFMHETTDQATYRAAIAYSILSDGIPIVYYGSEWFASIVSLPPPPPHTHPHPHPQPHLHPHPHPHPHTYTHTHTHTHTHPFKHTHNHSHPESLSTASTRNPQTPRRSMPAATTRAAASRSGAPESVTTPAQRGSARRSRR